MLLPRFSCLVQSDVAVLDCQLPEMEGTEVAQEIRRRGLPVRVLALSSYDDERYVRGMLEAGAVGYLLKEEAPETIVAAVWAAARGEGYFSPPVASKVAAWVRGERPGGLTEREMEVVRLVAEGMSNKEIAHKLKVKKRTVEFHMGNILGKLGVASQVEAAVWKEHGVVP
jgi:DNA-binding NarL/FixJ family response regulator